MSSILTALKKLENDNRGGQDSPSGRISEAQHFPENADSQKKRRMPFLGWALCALAALGLIGFVAGRVIGPFHLKKPGTRQQSAEVKESVLTHTAATKNPASTEVNQSRKLNSSSTTKEEKSQAAKFDASNPRGRGGIPNVRPLLSDTLTSKAAGHTLHGTDAAPINAVKPALKGFASGIRKSGSIKMNQVGPAPLESKRSVVKKRALLSTKKRDAPKINLQGIAWSSDVSRRVAIIDGVSLTEGRVINGVTIVSIEKGAIILKKGANTWRQDY